MTEQRNTSGKLPAGADVAGGGAGDSPSPVVTQADRDRVMRILNFAFRNTDVVISGEVFDDMASEVSLHREAEQERCTTWLDQKADSLEMLARLNLDGGVASAQSRLLREIADFFRSGKS